MNLFLLPEHPDFPGQDLPQKKTRQNRMHLPFLPKSFQNPLPARLSEHFRDPLPVHHPDSLRDLPSVRLSESLSAAS